MMPIAAPRDVLYPVIPCFLHSVNNQIFILDEVRGSNILNEERGSKKRYKIRIFFNKMVNNLVQQLFLEDSVVS